MKILIELVGLIIIIEIISIWVEMIKNGIKLIKKGFDS